ncbi:MAG: transcriptional regulator, MarR family [Labilithrix sp.]|nr:transcriptional regulator, MarR family [Labilithrix sp.]
MGSHRIGGVQAVLDPLRVLVRALRLSGREAEKELGVTGAQLFVLQSLRQLEAASINDLAAATHTDQSSVSVVVRRLADAGLVTRRTSELDARRVEVRLTAAGKRLLVQAPETAQSRIVRALAEMSAARRDELAAALAELAAATGLGGAPPMFFEDPPRPAATARTRPAAAKSSRA